MAAPVGGADQLLEISKYLVILTLCHFSSCLIAQQDVAEGMIALSLGDNNLLCCCHLPVPMLC